MSKCACARFFLNMHMFFFIYAVLLLLLLFVELPFDIIAVLKSQHICTQEINDQIYSYFVIFFYLFFFVPFTRQSFD